MFVICLSHVRRTFRKDIRTSVWSGNTRHPACLRRAPLTFGSTLLALAPWHERQAAVRSIWADNRDRIM